MEAGFAGFSIDLLDVVKVFFLIAIGLYVVFALVVVKQVRIMTDTIEIGLEAYIKLFSYLHLIAAAVVFAFAFVTL